MSEHTQGKVEIYESKSTGCIYLNATKSHTIVKALSNIHISKDITKSNAERIVAIWNAADGMSNEEAVKALENYKILKQELRGACQRCRQNADYGNIEMSCRPCKVRPLLTKLESHE